MNKKEYIERYGEEAYRKHLEYFKQHYQQHKEEAKQYYQKHKEEAKQYYQQHKEEKKQYQKQYDRYHKKMFAYCIPEEWEQIENYWLAKADNFDGWHCHHRLETHYPDGEKRLVNISMYELIAQDMYYNRPASELVFLTKSEHISIHNKKVR